MNLTYFIYLQLTICWLIKHFTVIYGDVNKQFLTLNLNFFCREKISLSGTPISLPKIADLPIWAQQKITCMHFVVFITSFLHLNKFSFDNFGKLQSDFCKNCTEFYQISLKNLPCLTDFSPQLMACMHLSKVNVSCLGFFHHSSDALQEWILFLWILSTCKLWQITHKLSKAQRALC